MPVLGNPKVFCSNAVICQYSDHFCLSRVSKGAVVDLVVEGKVMIDPGSVTDRVVCYSKDDLAIKSLKEGEKWI